MTGRVYYVMVQDRPLVKVLTFQNGTQGTAAATATVKRGSPDYDLLYLQGLYYRHAQRAARIAAG